MENLSETVTIVSVFSLLLFLVVLILLIVLATQVTVIRNLLSKKYICKYCGFKTKTYFDFCPICDKNDDGKTLKELRDEYNVK